MVVLEGGLSIVEEGRRLGVVGDWLLGMRGVVGSEKTSLLLLLLLGEGDCGIEGVMEECVALRMVEEVVLVLVPEEIGWLVPVGEARYHIVMVQLWRVVPVVARVPRQNIDLLVDRAWGEVAVPEGLQIVTEGGRTGEGQERLGVEDQLRRQASVEAEGASEHYLKRETVPGSLVSGQDRPAAEVLGAGAGPVIAIAEVVEVALLVDVPLPEVPLQIRLSIWQESPVSSICPRRSSSPRGMDGRLVPADQHADPAALSWSRSASRKRAALRGGMREEPIMRLGIGTLCLGTGRGSCLLGVGVVLSFHLGKLRHGLVSYRVLGIRNDGSFSVLWTSVLGESDG